MYLETNAKGVINVLLEARTSFGEVGALVAGQSNSSARCKQTEE